MSEALTGLVRLKEYRVLFSDHDALKLLNAAGGAFMWDLQQILWRDLLLPPPAAGSCRRVDRDSAAPDVSAEERDPV